MGTEGTELVKFTAADLVEKLHADSYDAIDAAAVARTKRLYEEGIEKKIQEHYEKMAEKALVSLWKRCGQRSNHDQIEHISTDHHGNRIAKCLICNAPLVDGQISKGSGKAKAIHDMAKKLRAADREAGIEYIPKS